MRLRLDSELGYEIKSPGAQPLVFEPEVNWRTINEPNIINAC